MSATLVTYTVPGRVSDIAQELQAALPAGAWVLMRCLDSERDPDSLRVLMQRIAGVTTSVDGYPIFEASALASVASKGLLVHFDELWFFLEQPRSFPAQQDEALATSDCLNLEETPEWEGLEAVARSGAFLVTGDGDFTNVIVAADAVRWLPDALRVD